MWSFSIVVFPAQIFSPLMEFVNQHFAFSWRLSLMESYITRWESSGCELEGASQRIHEDTQRFATSLQRGTTTLLQSARTTAHVAQPVMRSSPVEMVAELPSRRATMLSAASLLVLPLAAQAKPEDYVGGYTTKMYEETYKKKPDKGPACPPPGGPYCENPGGSPKDPLISRPSAFDKINGPVPVVIAKKVEAAPKKEAEAAPKE